MGVNLWNGNLHLMLGSGSCVTCGGDGPSGAYPNPQSTTLNGPVLVFNTLGTSDTDLGPKWMLPYHATITENPTGFASVIDADGTKRDYEEAGGVWVGDIEEDVLTADATHWYLTRFNGDVWRFVKSTGKLDKISSRTGHEITIARDGNGRITTITDGFGRVTNLYYITFGSFTRLNEIREPAPGDVGWYSTFLQYDSSGRLTQITNPMGEATRFEYDASNRISKAFDGHGSATEYSYDASNRVTNIKDPAAKNTGIAYPSSTVRNVTNRLSKVTEYTFDAQGRITKIKDALNNETEYTWDSTTWEQLTELRPKIPATGTPWTRHKIVKTYNTGADQHERQKEEVRKITDTDSTGTLLKSEEWTYNAQHDILTYKNPLGKIWTYTYQLDGGGNSVGLIATRANPLTQTIETRGYDNAANKYRLLTITNGVNKVWTHAYNQNTANSYGTPDKITAPSGAITNLKVDVRGRIFEQTGPSGNTEKVEFDALDRAIRQIHPDGTSTETVYDCCHIVAVVDENKHGFTYDHDVMGRVVKEIDPNGEETSFGYNDEGWRTSVTNPRGKTITTAYDDIGRPTSVDLPGVWTESYTYYEPGMLKTKVNSDGTTTTTVTYEYDDLYHLKKKDFPSGTDTEFETDANDRPTKIKDGSGEKRLYYDDADRLIKVEQGPTGFTVGTSENYVLEYTWNAASQRTQMDLTVRTQTKKSWTYTYTDDGYLDVVTNLDSDQTKHEYLTDGRLKKITLKFQTNDKKSTREVFYQDTSDAHAYVANKNKHLRKTLDKKQAGTEIVSYEYELDAAGNRLSVKDKDGKYTAYGYDPRNQLKSETKWSAKTPGTREFQNAFLYDPNGNRIQLHDDGVVTAYTYGDNDEMTAAGSDTFTFDHFGNTKTKVSGGNTTTYNWDFESHLTSVDYPGTTNDDTHEYDGRGLRMRSKLAGAADWTNFIHDELTRELIAEYTLISGTFTIKSLNTWGIGLVSTNREGTKRYYHFDGLGSTGALTDTNETITDTYSYSAFGTAIAVANGSVNPFRFAAQWGYYDDGARGSQSGLWLLGLRYYNPSYGRFWSWDPLRDHNLYGYADNEATQAIDPSGQRRLDDPGDQKSGTYELCIIMCKSLICGPLKGAAKKACLKACEEIWCKHYVGGEYGRFYRFCWEKAKKGEIEECWDCCDKICAPLPDGAQEELCRRNCQSGCGA
jgi:RHS repeat-associated protein